MIAGGFVGRLFAGPVLATSAAIGPGGRRLHTTMLRNITDENNSTLSIVECVDLLGYRFRQVQSSSNHGTRLVV